MNASEAFFDSRERNVFVATAPATQVLEALEQGLNHALPIALVTGDPGVGKTATLHEAVARWAGRVQAAWLDASQSTASSIFADAIRQFGGHVRGKDKRPEQVGRLTVALNAIRARNLVPVLVIDNAQLLDSDSLLELARMESASSAAGLELKIVFAGRPELNDRLSSDVHEQLAVHIGVRAELGPMAIADTREFVKHVFAGQTPAGEELFVKRAVREIHDGANGIPGIVRALADEAIRCAHATGSAQVGPEHVRAVIAAAIQGENPGAPATLDPMAQGGAGVQPGVDPAAAIPAKPQRIAAHNPPLTPPGAEAHLPPPASRRRPPSVSQTPDLDGSHPRVRDWVSRFTDGQPPLRFGGRVPLPANDPSDVFPEEPPPPAPEAPPPVSPEHARFAPPPAPPPVAPTPPVTGPPTVVPAGPPLRKRRLERARDAEMLRKVGQGAPGATPQSTPPSAPPVWPGASKPAAPAVTPAAASAQPPLPIEPPAPKPAAVPLEVTPDQLTPPPLVLDIEPAVPKGAHATPPPAPPRASVPPPALRSSSPQQPGLQQPPAEATWHQQRPGTSPGGSQAHLTRKQRRAAAREAERLARRAAQSARGAGAQAPAPPPGPPVVLTPDEVKPVSVYAPPPRKGAARQAPVPAGVGNATAELKSHLRPTPTDALIEDKPSGAERALAVLVPAVLVIGMAAAAWVLGQRGAFDRLAVPHGVEPTTAAQPQVDTPSLPTPDATPVPITDTTSRQASDTTAGPAADARPFEPPVDSPTDDPYAKPLLERASGARYCLAVGTYLFADRAEEKARTLAFRTGKEAWVEPIRTGGTRGWRILFGSYSSEGEAERAADRLLTRGLVTEALVENLPASRRNQ